MKINSGFEPVSHKRALASEVLFLCALVLMVVGMWLVPMALLFFHAPDRLLDWEPGICGAVSVICLIASIFCDPTTDCIV